MFFRAGNGFCSLPVVDWYAPLTPVSLVCTFPPPPVVGLKLEKTLVLAIIEKPFSLGHRTGTSINCHFYDVVTPAAFDAATVAVFIMPTDEVFDFIVGVIREYGYGA